MNMNTAINPVCVAEPAVGDKNRRRNIAAALSRTVFVGFLATGMSGCAMMQLGGMFGGSSSLEQTTASISRPVVPQERSLAMAANDLVPVSVQPGAAGECPPISIWRSDAQLTIYEAGRVGDNMAIRHRGEITRTARECEIAPGKVTVKFGVAGRVLLGPVGKPGRIKLPVLVHVTNRKSEKIQTSKLDVTVNMVDGKPWGNFSTVRSVSFPKDPALPANQYRVYVTFDKSAPDAG